MARHLLGEDMKLLTVSIAVVALLTSNVYAQQDCDFDGTWDVITSEPETGDDKITKGDTISIVEHIDVNTQDKGFMVMHNKNGVSEYMCVSKEPDWVTTNHLGRSLADARSRIRCTYNFNNDIMLFNAYLVKNGESETEFCSNTWFGEGGEQYSGDCGKKSCLIFWRIESVGDGREEGSGQGTGGNDGGTTPP